MSLTPVLTDAESRRKLIRAKALEAIRASFPLTLRDKKIEVTDLKVYEKDFGPNDQKQALLSGGSLHEPVKGTLVLRDSTGKELERVRNFTLLNLPFFTGRHTFIVDGNEYNVSNQLRLKPGVYTRRRGNEELEAAFNLSKGTNFRLSIDPTKGHPYIEYGTTAIPLFPILRKLGVPQQDIAAHWGADVTAQNAAAFADKHEKHVDKLYGKLVHPSKRNATNPDTQLEAIRNAYASTSMDPEVTSHTLGHAFDKVTPHAMLVASKRLLNVYKNNEDTDDRDALRFKTYHSVDDFIKERITLDARALANKVKLRATHKSDLRAILPSSPFSSGIRSFLTGSQLSSIPTHINPMESIDHAVRVTSLGEGGIANERAIPAEARTIHSSHLGILDPIRTSESFRAGIDIRTAMMAHRDARGNLYTGVRDVKTGKHTLLSAGDMAKSVIAFPGQKLVGMVAAMNKGTVEHVPAASVTHELFSAGQLYSPATNLVPFLESVQGNRGIMGGKVQTQALPLVHREAPWVQSAAHSGLKGDKPTSWEKELASLALPTAPVAGKVVKIDSQYIYLDPSGKKHAEDFSAAYQVKLAELEKRAGAVKRQKTIQDIVFKLELEVGDKRTGTSPDGKKWEKVMSVCYGHIPKTIGDDGETVDVYLKEDGTYENVYVVHQKKKDGAHDEDKCMVGFATKDEAKEAYEKHGPEWGYGSLSEYTWDEFRDDYLTERKKESAEKELIRVPYETYLPFASKTYLHHDLTIKPGDHVDANQHMAESNFTRDGAFALGRNMNIAYIPYYGMNSNDAVVISEGAADKLTSEHMYKEVVEVERDSTLGRDVHKQYYGTKYSADQYRKLDANGVVRRGTKVLPHDLLIAGVTKGKLSASDAMLGNLKKTLVHPYRELVRTWDHDFEGEVIDVHATDKRVVVTIKTREPMRVGDKLTGRHGNKGVVSMIVPDHKMLQDESGKPVDVLYTSAGVISRINPAQILETAVAKVAKKIGKPIAVENFSGRDNVQWAKGLLKEHNVKDKETLFDPVAGKKIPGILVGPQYVLRLFKTTETNFAARGTGAYDVNQQPIKGGDEGAKAVGKMEFNALVAHNARNVLRETAAIKSQKNDEFWRAVQLGLPLPPLKAPFAYDKFVGMLQGAGVRVDSRGSLSTLGPLTDNDITRLSAGAIQNEKLVRSRDLAPERGGLFDPAVTGGTTGTRWGHINLAEPVVNPIFSDSARRLLGMTAKEFDAYMHTHGGGDLKRKLNTIDVPAKIQAVRADIKRFNGVRLDDAVKQLKLLEALQKQGLKAGDAYVLSKFPVLPPVMRPILAGRGGSELVVGDSNYLYQSAMLHNNALQRQVTSPVLPPEEHAQLRKNLFTAIGAVVGTHESDNPKLQKRSVKGFLEHLTGKTTPKSSFFQKKIMKRQQDISGRGTIAPDGSLGMDEVGIPEDMLWGMYGKFIISRLVRRGFGALAAKDMVEQKHPAARDALAVELKERPVMVNRAPTLHRYGFVGAHPVPVAGKTIRVNPFIELGMNADYDGNCFIGSTKVALTAEADALNILRYPSPEASSMKFGPSTKILLSNDHTALVEVELQDVPRSDVSYTVDANGARSYRVPAGLCVWSYDHSAGVPVMAPIDSLTVEDGCAVATVTTRGGFEVTASTNESLCVYDHETESVRDLSPSESAGRLVPVALRLPLTGTQFDFDTGWTVGAFVSDGFFMGDREHYYGYTKVSDAHRDRFAAGVTSVEGRQLKRTTYREEHVDAAITGASVKDHYYGADKSTRLFKQCYVEERLDGRASLSKTLPDFSTWSVEARWGLVVGLLDGDGCLTYSAGKAKKQVLANVATSAPGVAYRLQTLLRSIGVRSSITESRPKAGRMQVHTAYTVTISTVDLQKNLSWLRRGILSGAKTQEALTLLEGAGLKDQRDIVPVPHRLMALGAASTGPCSSDTALRGSLATTKSSRKSGPYVSRDTAVRMLAFFKAANVPGLSAWEQLVTARDVTWDIVEDVTPAGTATVYDLIVPSTQVFAVDGGLIVWDTFQIHVPVLKPAVDEVKTMTLSNLIFSDREKDTLMVAPRMEAMLGVHLATKSVASPNDKTHKFKTKADAYAAYKRGEITLNTKVEIG